MNNVTDIGNSVPIMLFLVIIASLIVCMILIIIEKIIEGRQNIGLVSVIGTYMYLK